MDFDPECAQAYLGKLLVQVKAHRVEELWNVSYSLANYRNFQKALRFANPEEKEVLLAYLDGLDERVEKLERERLYKLACEIIDSGTLVREEIERAKKCFAHVGENYKDTAKYLQRIGEIEKKEKEANREAGIGVLKECMGCLGWILLILFGPFIIALIFAPPCNTLKYKCSNTIPKDCANGT